MAITRPSTFVCISLGRLSCRAAPIAKKSDQPREGVQSSPLKVVELQSFMTRCTIRVLCGQAIFVDVFCFAHMPELDGAT